MLRAWASPRILFLHLSGGRSLHLDGRLRFRPWVLLDRRDARQNTFELTGDDPRGAILACEPTSRPKSAPDRRSRRAGSASLALHPVEILASLVAQPPNSTFVASP